MTPAPPPGAVMTKEVDKLFTMVLMNAIVKKRAVIGKNVFHSSAEAPSLSAVSVMSFFGTESAAVNLLGRSETTPAECG